MRLPLILAATLAAAPALADSSRDSLDWPGRYTGALPCASCEAIDSTLFLNQDGSYRLLESYRGEKDAQFTTEGQVEWAADGGSITLGGDGRRYRVGEGAVEMLDADGQPGGDLYRMLQSDGFAGQDMQLWVERDTLDVNDPDAAGHRHVRFLGTMTFPAAMQGGHRSLVARFDIDCAKGSYDLPVVQYYEGPEATGKLLHEAADNAGHWLPLPASTDPLAQAGARYCTE